MKEEFYDDRYIDLRDKKKLFFNHLNSFKDPFSNSVKNILHESNNLNTWMKYYRIIHDEKGQKIYLKNNKTNEKIEWVKLIYEKMNNNIFFIKQLNNIPLNWKKINWMWVKFINILKLYLNKWDIILLNNKVRIKINWKIVSKEDYYNKQWFIHRNNWYEYFIK